MNWFKNIIKLILPSNQAKNTKELLKYLSDAAANNVINNNSFTIIYSVIQNTNMKARDIMTPNNKMVSIDINADVKDILKIMSDSAHSRFPVFDDDKVKGILLAKDLFNSYVYNPDDKHNINDYLRPHLTVPESKTLELLLKEFQVNKNHMALVVDEYGAINGLLTIEDVLEQIVGEIEDEHDFEEDNIIDYGKGRYLVRASTTMNEFNKFFDVKLENNTHTIAGFVLSGFEKMPEQSEEIILSGFSFTVIKCDSRKIRLLEVKKI